MRKKAVLVLITIVVILASAFAYYTFSPLFRNIRVDEKAPVSNEERVNTQSFSVTGTTGHPASGVVQVVRGEGASYIRYENFKTINGPDLYVYLATDLEATDFVDLGALKATEGNVNYEIPAGVDMSRYRYVMVWCKQFGVLFNYAEISG